MIERPEFGAPCNGCGYCCEHQVCAIGSFTQQLVDSYGERVPGPCPALVTEPDGSKTCGMVTRPRDYSPARAGAHELRAAIRLLIGANIGCDDTDARVPAVSDQEMDDFARRGLEKMGGEKRIAHAFQIWFGL